MLPGWPMLTLEPTFMARGPANHAAFRRAEHGRVVVSARLQRGAQRDDGKPHRLQHQALRHLHLDPPAHQRIVRRHAAVQVTRTGQSASPS